MSKRMRFVDREDFIGVAQLSLVQAVNKYYSNSDALPDSALIARCIRCDLVDYLRKQLRLRSPVKYRTVSIDAEMPDGVQMQIGDTRELHSDAFIKRESNRARIAAIGRVLDTRTMKVLEMSASGFTQSEIGVELGIHGTRVSQIISEGAARVRSVVRGTRSAGSLRQAFEIKAAQKRGRRPRALEYHSDACRAA